MCYPRPADVHWPPGHEYHNERSGDSTADGLEEIQLLPRQCEFGAIMTLTARRREKGRGGREGEGREGREGGREGGEEERGEEGSKLT